MNNIIILGYPGSGKGTISNRLKDNFDYKLICTGDILRQEKASGSEIGKKIGKLIDKGNLVPDTIVDKLVYNEVKKGKPLSKSFLIDGYPRSINQALRLDQMINVSVVIWLSIPDELTIERNTRRGRMGSGRPDDSSEEIIKKRLDTFKKISLPVKKWYEKRIVEVNAEGTMDDVYQRIIDTLFETIQEPRDLGDII